MRTCLTKHSGNESTEGGGGYARNYKADQEEGGGAWENKMCIHCLTLLKFLQT